MNKDDRYSVVRRMINSGEITEFDEIFKFIPKTVVRNDLGTNNSRMTALIKNPEKLELEEVYILSVMIEVSIGAVLSLAYKNFFTNLGKTIPADIKKYESPNYFR